MKRSLLPYFAGLIALFALGSGVLAGQDVGIYQHRAPHPHGGGPGAVWLGQGGDFTAVPAHPVAGQSVYIRGEQGPWLGVVISDISAEKAKELKLPAGEGVLITEVREESPAAKAGAIKDDVIVEFAGERVRSAAQLRRLVRETPPEREVTLVVNRAGQSKRLTAKLESRAPGPGPMPFGGVHVPNGPQIELPNFDVFFMRGGARLGISGDDLTTQLAEFFGVKQGEGVLVREVTVGSAAEKGGLKAGDVIVAVDGNEVASVGELRRALAPQKAETETQKVTLTIVRDKQEQSVTVELEAPERFGPRPFTRTELGIDPQKMEEIRAKAAEMAARARENEQQWREQAQKLAEQQHEWQGKLQEEMQRLQEELPKLEKEIRRNLGAVTDGMRTI